MRIGKAATRTFTSSALVMAVIATPPAAGQAALVPTGRQNLQFGVVIPGFPTVVNRLDAGNAGQYQIRGQRRAEVQVDLTLPAALVSGTGANLVLQFAAGDGGFSTRPAVGTAQAFDPQVPLVTALGNNGRLYIFLGGTVLPTPIQQSGAYQATITLTVSYTGN